MKLAQAALRIATQTVRRYKRYLNQVKKIKTKAEKKMLWLGRSVAIAERTEDVAVQTLAHTQDDLDIEMRQAGLSDLPDECAEEPNMASPVASSKDESSDEDSDREAP